MSAHAYCAACRQPRKSGYCIGPPDAPHPPESCPPCSGCKLRCDWNGQSCRRFRHSQPVFEAKQAEYTRRTRMR